MEKFIRIAESIADLEVFNEYQIARLDIQLNEIETQFHAFLTLRAPSGKDTIDIEILPNGSFKELWDYVGVE